MHTFNSHFNNSGVSDVFTPVRQRGNDALTILYILSRNIRNKSWSYTNYLWKIKGIPVSYTHLTLPTNREV